MEAVFVVLLILVLAGVAYAQWQRGAVRTVGSFLLDEEENRELAKLAVTSGKPDSH